MNGYSVSVKSSSRDLTARERIKVKDTSNAVSLDEATKSGKLTISIDYYVALEVRNEHAEDKEYHKYVIVDLDGNKYVTGSESFYSSLVDIVTEMADSGEDYQIEIYRLPSKKYQGKEFLTCSLV